MAPDSITDKQRAQIRRQAERLGRELLSKIAGAPHSCARAAAGCDPASWGRALFACLDRPESLAAVARARDASDPLSQAELESCALRALMSNNPAAFAILARGLLPADALSAPLTAIIQHSSPDEAYFEALLPSLSVNALGAGLRALCQRSSFARDELEWAQALISAGASPTPYRAAALQTACARERWELADFLAPFCDERAIQRALALAPPGALPATEALAERAALSQHTSSAKPAAASPPPPRSRL